MATGEGNAPLLPVSLLALQHWRKSPMVVCEEGEPGCLKSINNHHGNENSALWTDDPYPKWQEMIFNMVWKVNAVAGFRNRLSIFVVCGWNDGKTRQWPWKWKLRLLCLKKLSQRHMSCLPMQLKFEMTASALESSHLIVCFFRWKDMKKQLPFGTEKGGVATKNRMIRMPWGYSSVKSTFAHLTRDWAVGWRFPRPSPELGVHFGFP